MHFFWDKFQDITKRYPDHIALNDRGHKTTYAELCQNSTQLGESLKQQGIGFEKRVGIAIEKSDDYITALLAVWYAGGAFIPLPPDLPKTRQDFIKKDAEIDLVLTSDNIPISTEKLKITPASVSSDTLAYIIYTSGSTGQPKGVMVEHGGILNIIEHQIQAFKMIAGNVSLFYLSIGFDASLSDIGCALLSGATLIIEEDDQLKDAPKFLNTMQHYGITHIDMPPSLMRIFDPKDMPDHLETIIIGGEASQPEIIRNWAQCFNLVNVYGPTEATICSSLNKCDPSLWNKAIIGAPVPNTQYHILDADLTPVKMGELYISGIQLARGYLNQPALTAEKFITHNGQRLYKTGDKVCEQDNGDIAFLGRIDRQFKLRGQLIEPDEIEACLAQHPSTLQSAVLKRKKNKDGTDILMAFVTLKKSCSISELTTHIQKTLPSWMTPQHFEIIDHMPKTNTGKIDLSALKTLPIVDTAQSYEMPDTVLEEKLYGLYAHVLKHQNFGITDDFFTIGGDSLNVMNLSLSAEKQGFALSPNTIIQYPSVKELSHYIEHGNKDTTMLTTAKIISDLGQAPPLNKPVFREIPLYQNILLTGATGFLGSQLLSELLKNTTAQVYCLIRATDNDQAWQRLQSALDKHSLIINKDDLKRITVLTGDLSLPNFNLNEELWQKLTHNMDAIYHCAAWVNMMQDYQTMYSANVISSFEIARFATEGVFKHLHYASTLSVFVATNNNTGTVYENHDMSKTTEVYGGYAQTKWASEYYLQQIPDEYCKITHYRFGLITADTKTGYSAETEALSMFIKGITSLKSAPDMPKDSLQIDITPIDYAAKAMCQLSLNGKHATYHIANKKSLSLNTLIDTLNDRGFNITLEPAQSWIKKCQSQDLNTTQSATYLALCRCLEDFNTYRVMDLFQATGITFDTSNTDVDFDTSCPEPDPRLLNTYLDYIFPETKGIIKICIFGPESTGKSTLSKKLGAYFKVDFVPEYAKELIERNGGEITLKDIDIIGKEQIKSEQSALRKAEKMIICDTDLITTTIWSHHLFKTCPSWIKDIANKQTYDLYLLMDIDVPWVDDIHRYAPDDRAAFLKLCEDTLKEYNRPFIKVSGNWEERFDVARTAIKEIMNKKNH